MTSISQGDMAQAFLLRRQNTDLKTALNRLTYEMSSGRQQDLSKAVGGDFKVLAGIEHSLSVLASFRTAASEAGTLTESLQSAFETVQTITTDLAPSLNAAGTTGGATHIATAAYDARQKLFSAVSALNVRVGDRYALSGTATDQRPILGAQEILDELAIAITGQVTATGVIGAVDAWFDAPPGGGGYVDTIYGGSATPLQPFRIGEGEEASLTLTATDDTLRDTLKGLALAAIIEEGALPGDLVGQGVLMKTAGQRLMGSGGDLATLRANLGAVEAQIASVSTRNESEASALELARNRIVAADPYETANELQAVQTQLETLYAITARLSRLTLTDYLR
ncbi:flagellin [Frigidibacter sp. SD6-1]|uniref:flagellin n=1 Tax=Frigidibacter sp. SD6-1 TaxID=3032581 RepID=UPI0024DF49F2|nr:flagellin [Frigidibacter sp. SD6-1]